MDTQNVRLGQIITGYDQVIVEVDDTLVDIIARDRADPVGRHALSFTFDRDLGRNQPMLDKLTASGPSFAITKRYVRGDTSVIWVHNHVSVITDGLGNRMICATVEQINRPFGREAPERNHWAARQLCASFVMGKAAFGSEIFCSPPSEALLLLYTAELEATAITVEEIAQRIDITTSVMLRWLKLMRERGLVEVESGEPLGPLSVLRISRDCELTLDGLLSRWTL